MDKEQDYRKLCADRQKCGRCERYFFENASKIKEGQFDCDEVGAYSHWQGNLDSDLMVIGQDFADADIFIDNHGRPGRDVSTNKRLVKFLAAAGVAINPPPARGEPDVSDDKFFFTNAVLCMKPGDMRGAVPTSCFRACGDFLHRTVKIVNPLLVVTLGVGAMNAVNRVFALTSPARLPLDGASPQAVRIMDSRT